MNRDGIAEPRYPSAPAPPGQGEPHVWRVELPAADGREAARAALRAILAAYLGRAPGEIVLTVGERGKPALEGGEQVEEGSGTLGFNLSHSGGLALVAVAAPGTEVGVDVERLRPRRDLVRLAERWLPEADAAVVAATPEEARGEAFYAAWTRFEARAKCTGAGLSGPPPGPEAFALPLEIDPGYAAALATVGSAPTVVHRFDFSRLDLSSRG